MSLGEIAPLNPPRKHTDGGEVRVPSCACFSHGGGLGRGPSITLSACFSPRKILDALRSGISSGAISRRVQCRPPWPSRTIR